LISNQYLATSRYLLSSIVYEAVMAASAAAVVWYAPSYTAVFPLLLAVGYTLCLGLMRYTVSAALNGNLYRYPYGTGRLENLSAFILSAMTTVGALVPCTQAMRALLAGTPHAAGMGWTSLLLLVSMVGNSWQCLRAHRLCRSSGGPMLESLYCGYRTAIFRDGCACVLIGLCWVGQGEDPTFMGRLDSLATIGLTLYVWYHFAPQIWVNVRSLADFPVAEENQLKILRLLARYYDRYRWLGLIYTANKGRTQVIEVELGFDGGMTMAELAKLEHGMRQDFQQHFPDCLFRIIPRAIPSASKGPETANPAG